MSEVTAAILIFAAGWLITFLYDRSKRASEARLERISHQIRDLYGPLLAGIRESEVAWDLYEAHFNEQFYPGLDDDRRDPEWPYEAGSEKLLTWMRWNRQIFQPINERMRGIIEHNLDLFDEEDVPDELRAFLNHVISWKAVLSDWEAGDFSRIAAVNKYPAEMKPYVKGRYERLKVAQKRLLHGSARPRIN